jgi:disulfide oxidoreductase YuzD
MLLKKLLILILSSIVLASCIKVETVKPVDKQIRGRITDTVVKKPFAQKAFILRIVDWENKAREERFITNEDGYFDHSFKTETYSKIFILNTVGNIKYWEDSIGNNKSRLIDAGEIKGTIFLRSKVKGVMINEVNNQPLKNTEFWITVESPNDSTGQTDLNHYPFFTDSYGQFEKGMMIRSESRVAICYPNTPSQKGGRDFGVIRTLDGTEVNFGYIKAPQP